MPAPVPVLDDRSFDDLVLEARSLIPRVLPEWTDYNPSDPGVTLLELFAYLVETLFFQVDQIGERTLDHFATLLGAARPPAGAPAGPAPDGVAERLRRAVTARALPSRAVTAADAVFQLRHALRQAAAPVREQHPAGAAVTGHATVRAVAQLTGPATAATLELTLAAAAGTPVVLADDLLVPAGEAAAEVVRVVSVQPRPSGEIRVELAAPLRFGYPAGTRVDRVSAPAPAAVTTLAVPLLAGSSMLRVVPAPALPLDGVLLVDGEYVPAGAVARAAVVALDRLADDGRIDRVLSALLVTGAGLAPAGDELLQAAYDLLRSVGPLGSRVEVTSPPVLALPLQVTVVREAAGLLSADAVARRVLDAVRAYLDPLTGGRDGTGWPFGGLVYRSELYRIVEGVPGVDHVSELLLAGDPAADQWPTATTRPPGADATWLVALEAARIQVRDR